MLSSILFHFDTCRHKTKKKRQFVQNNLKFKSISFAIIIVQLRNKEFDCRNPKLALISFYIFFPMCTKIFRVHIKKLPFLNSRSLN